MIKSTYHAGSWPYSVDTLFVMAADPIEWGLTHLLGDRTEPGTGVLSRDVPARPFALVILNQPLENLSMVKTLWKKGMPRMSTISCAMLR